jgi:hypothetical protein
MMVLLLKVWSPYREYRLLFGPKKNEETDLIYFNRRNRVRYTRVYPKVSGLAAWSENCKWYSSLPLGAVISLFCELV